MRIKGIKRTMFQTHNIVRVTRDGFFIGTQPTKKYRGVLVPAPSKEDILFMFTNFLQDQGIQEIHCLTSETGGIEYKSGNPSGKHGANIWCRIKLVNGKIGNWFLIRTTHSPDEAPCWCMKLCVDNVWLPSYELMKELAPAGTEIEPKEINILGNLFMIGRLKQL